MKAREEEKNSKYANSHVFAYGSSTAETKSSCKEGRLI